MPLIEDFRYGWRMLAKTPLQTAAAVLALGLGLGLTGAMVSIVYGVVVRPLPFPESERVLHLENKNLSQDEESLEVYLADFLDWRREQRTFESLAAFDETSFNVSDPGEEPERVEAAWVTANTFDVLRVKPLLGRSFLAGEDRVGAARVVVLSHELWQQRYGGDREIVGRSIRVNAAPATVVGVMPPEFKFPTTQRIWMPLAIDEAAAGRGVGATYEVIGRPREGVSVKAASAEIEAITLRTAERFPATNKGLEAVVKPLHSEFIPKDIVALFYLMLAGVLAVLLIACLNVANLLLARASTRTRELSIRTALGADRRRVVVQLLAESFLLAIGGLALGVILAKWGVQAFNLSIAASNPPYWLDIRLDVPALLALAGVTLLAGLVSGLVPALKASRADIQEVLKDEGRGSSSLRMGWFSRAIVVAEVAFSCLLLVLAGLMIKSIVGMRNLSTEFSTEQVLTFRVALFEAAYPDSASRLRLYDSLLGRLGAQPGIEAVAASTAMPIAGTGTEAFAIEGRPHADPSELPKTRVQTVSPGYFSAFRARVLSGRDFGSADRADGEPVAIVNRLFAAKVFPNQDAVGHRIRIGRDEQAPFRRIVGVVPDLMMGGLDREDPEGVYIPMAQDAEADRMSFVVRAAGGDPLAQVAMVRREIDALDRDLPIYFVQTMANIIEEERLFFDVFSVLFAIFGGSALLLASVGIYAVVSFAVGQRTHEIGLRMALGARRESVIGMLLQQGAKQLLVGLGIGLPLALLAGRVLSNVFEVDPNDPWVLVAVPTVLGLVALLACFVPARRASRIDPAVAFRNG